jgi:hypothetical protein
MIRKVVQNRRHGAVAVTQILDCGHERFVVGDGALDALHVSSRRCRQCDEPQGGDRPNNEGDLRDNS